MAGHRAGLRRDSAPGTDCGVQWRDLPARLGPRKTVCERHRLWSADGTWERLLLQGGLTAELHLSADGRCRTLPLVVAPGAACGHPSADAPPASWLTATQRTATGLIGPPVPHRNGNGVASKRNV
ncbi:transposase [Streptomyces mexicanus]|uniref:transposase n=1 Tax=Streptomyces mexicanus TaxID=178566 RepID=UPI003B004BAF